MKTANGVEITHGLPVWDNNLDRGVVDLSSIDDGWFYVRYPNGGKNSMNGERVTTRHPFTGELADAACSQCGPGHDSGDGTCQRHGKRIAR